MQAREILRQQRHTQLKLEKPSEKCVGEVQFTCNEVVSQSLLVHATLDAGSWMAAMTTSCGMSALLS